MAKKFTFTNTKTTRIIYETVVPNHISEDNVVGSMIRDTGVDPRISVHISKSIRTVDDSELNKEKAKTKKRYKKK